MSAPLLSAQEAGRTVSALQQQVTETFRRHAARPGRLLRAEIEVPSFDPLHWLLLQRTGSRGFWSDRERSFELAGIGRADTVTSNAGSRDAGLLQRLHQRLDEAEGDMRYFGGLRFSASGERAEEWDVFGTYRFVLPRVEVLRRQGSSVLAVNLRSDESPVSVREEIAALVFPARATEPVVPSPTGASERPARGAWLRMIREAVDVLGRDGFEKVVLARCRTLRFEAPPDATILLRALRRRTADCFHFCFQPCRGHAFFGASPERLYRRDGRDVLTEAMAGTAPRSGNLEEDRRWAEHLMACAKERREQRLVVDGIQQILAPRCLELNAEPEPHVQELSRNQHLVTRFRGLLRNDVTDADLLTALHPTPAVGGCPAEQAEGYIEAHEPFDRGWFAGPVGWVARDAAQFVVGIRSALVDQTELHVYAGAGILPASDPASEWDETEQKMADLLSLLEGRT